MTYWTATVERPDGNGGWILVDVFGVKNHPGGHTASYLHGDTALDAAQLLLEHVWPINLGEYNKRDDPAKWTYRINAGRGLAGHRITLAVATDRLWSVRDGQPPPEPATYTVGELRLAIIRAEVIKLAAAKQKLAELTAQVKSARGDVQYHEWNKKEFIAEAARAGVPADDITRAARAPRQRKKGGGNA